MSHPNLNAMEAVGPVLRALTELRVTHYIGGSLASCAYSVARSTVDVDIVAEMAPEHAPRLARLLEPQFYADAESMRDSVSRGQSFNIIYLPLMFKVDIFPVKERRYDQVAVERFQYRPVLADDPTSPVIPVAAPEDVVLNKLEWYRLGNEVSERQWLDVLNVLKVQAGALNEAYLDRWAGELGVADLLDRARRQAAV